MPNLWLVFTTGLLAGGVTCLAVQGGLLAAAVASRAGEPGGEKTGGWSVTGSFLGAKLVSHIIFGGLLGMLGAVVQPSVTMRALMQTLAGIYMLGVAGAMLEVHPILRYFIIQPPRRLARLVRSQSKSGSWFAPAVLGAMTVFIPCGTTQAMMVLALGTGNPMWGAAVMGTFVLGTAPLFAGVGAVIARLGSALRENFNKLAAAAVAGMAVWGLAGAAALFGYPPGVMARGVYCTVTFCPADAGRIAGEGVDRVTVEILPNGYRADTSVLKAGSKVTLKLVNEETRGCAQAFTIPSLGVSEVVPAGSEKEVEIEVPKNLASLNFTCGMGMFSGQFTVVN